MPDAFSVFAWLSTHPDLRPTKIIALSGNAADADRAIANGADEFFVKFPTQGALARAVKMLNPSETLRPEKTEKV
jgi:CheY-like chemotaxis protein